MNFVLILTLLFFFNNVRAEDEAWMKEIEFDGTLLKINERIFEHMMKRVNYAIVLFYEDKDAKSTNAQDQMRLAAETIVQMSPAVGVFKMKCSENPKFCSELKKEEIPFILWINNYNFGIYKEKIEKDTLIDFCEKMVRFSNIKLLESKDEIAEFLMNNNFYRLLGIFPKNNPNDKNFFETLFENVIPNSIISKSGEFIFGKIVNQELTNYIYQNFSKTQDSILIFTKDDLLNFTNIFKIDDESFQRYRQKFNFISEFQYEKFYPFYLNHSDPTYFNNKENLVNDIILNALPHIFPLDQKFYNLAFGGPIQKHFLLVLHPDHLLNFEILDNYNNISKKFREKNYEIWFTFSMFDNEMKDALKPDLNEINRDDEKDFPVLLLFNLKNYQENTNKEDIEKYFFNKPINFENLEAFYLKFHKISKFDEVRHTITSEKVSKEDSDPELLKKSTAIDIPKVVGFNFKELVLDFPDNVLVLFLDNDEENLNLYRKWIFLLNEILRIANSQLLRIYKYNVQLNDNYLTQVPQNLPSIRLYIRHNKENPIEYQSGPSMLNLAKFLNELIPLLNLKISLQQVQEYNREIFSNPDYIEEKIYEFDDDGKEHLITNTQQEVLNRRGLEPKMFETQSSMNDSLKAYVETEKNKTENKEKYDL